MVKLRKQLVVKALSAAGFALQERGGDWKFVARTAVKGMYERIELVHTVKKGVYVFGVAISVVRDVRTGFRGLVESGGWEELCKDPENGRISFESLEAQSAWLERVVEAAPERFARLVSDRADALLSRTASARASAEQVFVDIVHPALVQGSSLDVAEKDSAYCKRLLATPFVVGCPELHAEYDLAVRALLLSHDPDVVQLASLERKGNSPQASLDSMLSVPDHPIWKIRLLVDRIVQEQREAGVCLPAP